MDFLSKLEQAINDEWTAYNFYDQLLSQTANPLYRDFIKHARDDENKHFMLLQEMYKKLTGGYYPNKTIVKRVTAFEQSVIEALKNELEATETYRDMLFEIPDQSFYQPLFKTMMDETEHSIRFSTILGTLDKNSP